MKLNQEMIKRIYNKPLRGVSHFKRKRKFYELTRMKREYEKPSVASWISLFEGILVNFQVRRLRVLILLMYKELLHFKVVGRVCVLLKMCRLTYSEKERKKPFGF